MNTEPIYRNRSIGSIGLDMYFHSVRTLMIFEHEVLYQLVDGIWSSNRYPRDHHIEWVNANLFLTQGKENVRTEAEIGSKIIKSDYNLKKILNIPSAFSRVESIGKLCNCINDVDKIRMILDESFHEYSSYIPKEYSYESYSEMMDSLCSMPECRGLIPMIDEDLIKSYIESEYEINEMKDDLGMIQNVIRKIEYRQYV